jgi:hypothetical protein
VDGTLVKDDPETGRFDADLLSPRHRAGARRAETFRPLVFLHIPKTAGTSMIELLARNFAAGEICRVTDIHRPIDDLAADLECAVADERRLICGHFPYDAIAGLAGQVRPFTMLRDPVDRIVSLYRFWRAQGPQAGGSPAGRFACNLARALDLEAFMACEHPLIVSATRDEMCKALSPGLAGGERDTDPASLLAGARAALRAMPFGLVERMPDSLRLLSHRLGLSLIEPVRLNAAQPADTPGPTAAQRELILRHNIADTALYQDASRLFARALQLLEIEQLYLSLGDRALSPLAAEGGERFRWDAAMAVSGVGWNDREGLADGRSYRFTSSPETVIFLPNRLPGQGFHLDLHVAFFNGDALLDRHGPVGPPAAMTFELDDTPVTATVSSGADGVHYRLAIPHPGRPGPFLRLAIRSGYGLPPSVFGSPDRRNLLAAVRSIVVQKG